MAKKEQQYQQVRRVCCGVEYFISCVESGEVGACLVLITVQDMRQLEGQLETSAANEKRIIELELKAAKIELELI